MRPGLATILIGFVIAFFTTPSGAQNAENGRQIYDMCLACHIDNGPGPALNGVYERKIGAVEGFEYSEALANANAKGQTWNEDALDQFLAAPQTYLPDNKMAFGAVTDPTERKDLIAFLKTLR